MTTYSFDRKTEEMLFRKAIPNILQDGVQFEGLPLTLLQTTQIVNNQMVDGVAPSAMLVVHDMHKGAQFVLENYETFTFEKLLQLHGITGRDDAPNPGELRQGAGGVLTTRGEFTPARVDAAEAQVTFKALLASGEAPAIKAAQVFSYLSRAQLFNDTNKRTAVLAANVPLLQAGAGVFYIPEIAMPNVLQLMGDYYWSNDNRLLTTVLVEVAVSDFDGKTFYDDAHQYYEYRDVYQKRLNLFKGLNAKGLLGKERYRDLTN